MLVTGLLVLLAVCLNVLLYQFYIDLLLLSHYLPVFLNTTVVCMSITHRERMPLYMFYTWLVFGRFFGFPLFLCVVLRSWSDLNCIRDCEWYLNTHPLVLKKDSPLIVSGLYHYLLIVARRKYLIHLIT